MRTDRKAKAKRPQKHPTKEKLAELAKLRDAAAKKRAAKASVAFPNHMGNYRSKPTKRRERAERQQVRRSSVLGLAALLLYFAAQRRRQGRAAA